VNYGFGTDSKVINERILEIWNTYVVDLHENGISAPEFETFVRNSFKAVKVPFNFKQKDMNVFIKKRFSIKHGKISKK
jgi:hypothetical protein